MESDCEWQPGARTRGKPASPWVKLGGKRRGNDLVGPAHKSYTCLALVGLYRKPSDWPATGVWPLYPEPVETCLGGQRPKPGSGECVPFSLWKLRVPIYKAGTRMASTYRPVEYLRQHVYTMPGPRGCSMDAEEDLCRHRVEGRRGQAAGRARETDAEVERVIF